MANILKIARALLPLCMVALVASCSTAGPRADGSGDPRAAPEGGKAGNAISIGRKVEQDLQFVPFRKKNTPKAYYQFMEQYPNNYHADEARLIAEELEFTPHAAKGTAEAYDEFINAYPKNRFVPVAHAAIEDIGFEKAKVANSLIGFAEFMKNYPTSPRLPEAGRLRDALEYEPYRMQDTMDALAEFVKAYPLNGYQDAALARLTELDNGQVKAAVEKVCAESRHNVSQYDCKFVSYGHGTLTVKLVKPAEAEQGQKYLMGGPGYAEEMARRFKEWKHNLFEQFMAVPGVVTIESQ